MVVSVVRITQVIEEQVEVEQRELVDEFRFDGIEVSLVRPLSELVDRRFTILELQQLIPLVSPLHPDAAEEEYLYAKKVGASVDGALEEKSISVPHYIGARIFLEAICAKYAEHEQYLYEIG